MNAVIALCHFCEAHGPSAIFCTQTLRDTKLEELQLDQQQLDSKMCSACNSLGQTNGLYSKDNESGATFLSTQTAALPDVQMLVKQAAVRSLSCEINSNKDGGFVFFGDSTRGHVLSHTFQVNDLQVGLIFTEKSAKIFVLYCIFTCIINFVPRLVASTNFSPLLC